jgi:hypothetical protein
MRCYVVEAMEELFGVGQIDPGAPPRSYRGHDDTRPFDAFRCENPPLRSQRRALQHLFAITDNQPPSQFPMRD